VTPEFVVVGAGLTGATIARQLHDAGRRVVVVDRRAHVAGNVYDYVHKESGVRIHAYGPHYFRTSSERVWEFVNRFSSFYPFSAEVRTIVDGRLETWPVTREAVERIGLGEPPPFTGDPSNLEEAALKLMPRRVYEKFVKEYNEKMWGCACTALSPRLCNRFEVRTSDDRRLIAHARWQALPVNGYAAMVSAMLDGIETHLGTSFSQATHRASRCVVYTGPIDAFFNCDMGRLPYRAQRRHHEYLRKFDLAQPCVQINNPCHIGGNHVRTIEWAHLLQPGSDRRGTVLTTETPYSPVDEDAYEYPAQDIGSQNLARLYEERASHVKDVVFVGRLARYAYLDMDIAIAKALTVGDRIITSS
jgi:UDP-galactopyranose mutase